VAALFVVIGAGVDHSVFQYEAARTHGASIDLAVFLSAATTIASMGLLGLSSAYPVRIFGIAVAVGVTAAYVFSFIAAHIGRGKRA
jgi:predicted exporter